MQVEQEAVRSLPAVIEAAAKSPLGLMALMVVLIAALGYAFFKEAPPRLKAIMFLVLFAGVAGFGFAVSRTIGSPASSQSSPPAGSVGPPSAPPPPPPPPPAPPPHPNARASGAAPTQSRRRQYRQRTCGNATGSASYGVGNRWRGVRGEDNRRPPLPGPTSGSVRLRTATG